MRKPYLDHIRFGTVILVLVYHVFYLYNHVGVLGGLETDTNPTALDGFSYAVYPWFMVLLFVIAGMSARYALQTRSPRQFFKERVTKLLVPSTLGLFVYHWITGYLNLRTGGALDYIPAPLVYPMSAMTGIGPLWFIQMLFLFSALLLLLKRLDRTDALWRLGGKANFAAVLLLLLPVWGAAQLLNLPVLTMYRFGIYGLAFFLGYYVFSHDSVQDALERGRIPLLLSAILLGAGYVYRYFGENYTSPQCLQSFFTNAYLWISVLAVLGCGKAWLNRSMRFSAVLARSGFGLYILHYPIVLAVCLLLSRCALPDGLRYLFAAAAVLGLTPAVYALIRRIPVARYLVLGCRKERPR